MLPDVFQDGNTNRFDGIARVRRDLRRRRTIRSIADFFMKSLGRSRAIGMQLVERNARDRLNGHFRVRLDFGVNGSWL